jgi:hypothetical protein
MTTTIHTNFKSKAEKELQNMREFCPWRGVGDEIASIRENLALAGLSLADIGTSEEELQADLVTGNKNSAGHWLRVAKERCTTQNVSCEISHIRSRLAEAKLTLADIGSSEEELSSLLPAIRPRKKGWRLLFSRKSK